MENKLNLTLFHNYCGLLVPQYSTCISWKGEEGLWTLHGRWLCAIQSSVDWDTLGSEDIKRHTHS